MRSTWEWEWQGRDDGHREVLVRGYVERVVISCAAEVIARHKRSYEREDLVFDPLHYLPLIERKAGALDQAAPLRGWDLATLRRLLASLPQKADVMQKANIRRLVRETIEGTQAAVGGRCAVAVRLVVDELLGEADLTFEAEGREAVEMLAEWERPKPASNLLPI